MVSKLNIFRIILTLVILVLAGAFLIPSSLERVDSAKEKLHEAEERLQEVMANEERKLSKAIEYCYGVDTIGCDELMYDWYQQCQDDNSKDIPSCQDGRIKSYLTMNGISTKITSNTSIIDNRINQDAIRLINVCTELQTEKNEIILSGQVMDESEEFKNYWHSLNEQTNSCRESINLIKTDCDSKKNTNDYYEACDDPRLKEW